MRKLQVGQRIGIYEVTHGIFLGRFSVGFKVGKQNENVKLIGIQTIFGCPIKESSSVKKVGTLIVKKVK